MTADPVRMVARLPWRERTVEGARVWTTGHPMVDGRLLDGDAAARAALALHRDGGAPDAWDGHFAAVVATPDGAVTAFVDRVASFPLFWVDGDDGARLGDDARALADEAGLAIDPDQALSVAMAGYTTGLGCLFAGLRRLPPGGVLRIVAGRAVVRRYFAYDSWAAPADGALSDAAVIDTLDAVMARCAATLKDRPILVPLSAGLDSRAIVSGLKRHGHRDVRCFAYGRPNNFEATASRAIAEALGCPWRFVPSTAASARRYFESALREEYWAFADLATGVPFEQDLAALRTLRDEGWVPDDAVVINGQSGDFLCGAHIPKTFAPGGAVDEAALTRAQLDKHYALWVALRGPVNDGRIAALLRADRPADAPAADTPAHAAGLFERAEYDDRQSKYVVAGQRVYDFLGLDWRMPLWEAPVIELFRRAPLAERMGRAAFRRAMARADWGGVWGDAWAFPFRPTPAPVWPVRQAAMALAAPFGAEARRALHRRLFAYWTDIVPNLAARPYGAVARDGRGFRNAIAWLTEDYLARQGLGWDGRPGAPRS